MKSTSNLGKDLTTEIEKKAESNKWLHSELVRFQELWVENVSKGLE